MGNLLLKLVMAVGRFDTLNFTVTCHYLVGIHHRHFKAPQTQIPPPLLIALEAHNAKNQSQLIRNVVIVNLKVVLVRQVDTKKLVGHVSFQ